MTKTLAEIAEEHRPWSERNFPDQGPLDPLEGLIEEMGELAHARLKRRQGIRHTPKECEAMERDAIGDMGLYLIDFARRTGTRLHFAPYLAGEGADRAETIFLRLCNRVGMLAHDFHVGTLHEYEYGIHKVMEGLCAYSCTRGWDFLEVLEETWARVGKRDWRADRMTAGEEAIA